MTIQKCDKTNAGKGLSYKILVPEKDMKTLTMINAAMKKRGLNMAFTHALVVQWIECAGMGDTTQTNTFQLIIGTNLRQTKAVFIYKDRGMNMGHKMAFAETYYPVRIGYVCKDRKNATNSVVKTYPCSAATKDNTECIKKLEQPDQCDQNGNKTNAKNVNFVGFFTYDVSKPMGNGMTSPSPLACKTNTMMQHNITKLLRSISQTCPTSKELMPSYFEKVDAKAKGVDVDCYQKVWGVPVGTQGKEIWPVLRCCYASDDDKSGPVTSPVFSDGGLPINTMLLIRKKMRPNTTDVTKAVYNTSMAFKYCCGDCLSASRCKEFLMKFPITGSTNATKENASLATGDPHFTTIDGLQYTFNGHGEFLALQATKVNNASSEDNFFLQVGTKQRNASENATVFYKIVAQQQVLNNSASDSSSLVEFNVANGALDVYIDKVKTTNFSTIKQASINALSNSSYSVTFLKYTYTVVATLFPGGILSFQLILSGQTSGVTFKGLLGNNDGNPANDLKYRNGTQLNSATATESDIYDMGLSWCVNLGPEGSLFATPTNPPCLSRAQFTPFFSDSLDWTGKEALKQQAMQACKNSTPCMLDILATGSVQTGVSTYNTSRAFAQVQAVRANKPPVWPMNELIINVTKGVDFTYLLNAMDADNQTLNYSLTNQPSQGSMTIKNRNQLSWTGIPDLDGATINAFQVSASDGVTNVPLTVQIRFCKCHKTQGSCKWDTGTGDFSIVQCQCQAGYALPYCDLKADPCKESKCFPGVKCNATDPAVLSQNSSAPKYTCGSCPPGYNGDGVSCTDINECTGTNNCDKTNGVCTNTPGSYTCGCKTGYLQDSRKNCVDVDECKTQTPCDVKTSTCNNTMGSFVCVCMKGYYMLNGQCADIDECKTNQDNCNNATTMCSNNPGGFTCECKPGFRKEVAGANTCVQIDDCLNANCTQRCTDKLQGYDCSCNAGYVPVANEPWKCQAAAGATCSSAEVQASCVNGTCAKPNSTVVCTCKNTETLVNNICVDKNECTDGTAVCKATTSTCMDKVGGYTCNCKAGYRKDTDGYSCIDVDECKNGTASCDRSYGVCTNTEGSYSCDCQKGYKLEANNRCSDVDECAASNKGGCDANYGVCTNVPGTYKCECKPGFTGDGFTCSDVDECNAANGGCMHTCTNTVGSRTCACRKGFTLSSDGKTCTDDDECAKKTHNCKSDTYCTNIDGGFKCSCPSHEMLTSDGSTCVSKVQCADGHGCSFACSNNNGTQTCTCKSGYKLAADRKNCEDVDECAADTQKTLCPAANKVVCSNTVGAYECTCANPTYYKKDSDKMCSDKDECLNNPCKSPAKCVNKEMGYNCVCPSGYTTDAQGNCIDINECANSTLDKCQANTKAKCMNTVPNFYCKCDTGYKLNSDTYSCSDTDECLKNPCDPVGGTCTNTPGSYTCGCKAGYSAINSTHCQNLDECKGAHGCQQVCTDTPGSFRCSCQTGYTLGSDGKTCTAATACASGHGCSQLCAVVSGANVCSCYNNSYSLGSDKKTCNGVDECKATPSPCKGNVTCTDKTPGFTCACTNNFKLSPDKVSCVDRDGAWSDWTSYSACSKACGTGTKTRTRTCTNPTKQGNGNVCPGLASDSENCNNHSCPLTSFEMSFGAEVKYETTMTKEQNYDSIALQLCQRQIAGCVGRSFGLLINDLFIRNPSNL
uniref:Matrilin-like protein n=1 Tax=Platynereis dumerilii TaxID=6359 RepID=C7SB45_PLADU|nr:matrilin-like protein [Platynereis dumerilii]